MQHSGIESQTTVRPPAGKIGTTTADTIIYNEAAVNALNANNNLQQSIKTDSILTTGIPDQLVMQVVGVISYRNS